MDRAIKTQGHNETCACALTRIDPHAYRQTSTRPTGTTLRTKVKELASERRWFGYRRLHILRKREGLAVTWKKLYRLYCEEGLTVRKRGGRKRAGGSRTSMAIPQGQNQRRSLDLTSDALEARGGSGC